MSEPWHRRATAAGAALAIDRVLGEPPLPARLHPVALFGTAIGALERRVYDDRRAPGTILAAAGVGLAAAAGVAIGSPLVGGYVSIAGRGLHTAALRVAAALMSGDVPAARDMLPSLVGRDPTALDAAAIARAAVESVAENTTDAIVAPALWTAAAGPVGAFVYRAGDTLDSMVGYRDDRYRRFGLASARLDDALAWVPARATAVLVALARPRHARAVARAVRRDAPRHPSPNAGVSEAAFAAALGLRLGGTNRYGGVVENRPILGAGRAPGPPEITAAVDLSRDVTWLLAGLLALAGTAGAIAGRRRGGAQPMTTIPAPGPHGGDGPRVAEALGLGPEQVVDLSASLNPFAPDVTALAATHLDSLRRYPDVEAAEGLLAEAVGVPGERLVLTAGGSQAIALVGDHLGLGWVEEPDFSLYRRHLPRVEVGAPRWRSDPHNPTGRLATTGDDRVAVWDEAFLPLSAGTWTRGRPGWGLGSLTKAFACPGLRLGFAVAPDDRAAAAVRRRRPAWAVGSLGCAVLPELLVRADLAGWTARIAAARADLTQVLRAHGLVPLPSDAPWVLAAAAPEGLRAALARHAVVVRDCRSFGLPDHVRIAVPDAAGLERLDAALARVRDVGDHDRP